MSLYESQLRALGAEMAMVAARHQLSISVTLYRTEHQATVLLQRGCDSFSVAFDLPSIDRDIRLDDYFHEYLAQAATALMTKVGDK